MSCQTHQDHAHRHGEDCGHTRIQHGDHADYLHDGHLHAAHGEHYDEHVVAVSAENPAACAPSDCACKHETDDCAHERLPHGDHRDYVVDGRLHFVHGNHCDDHGVRAV
jgi:hypothetical protein